MRTNVGRFVCCGAAVLAGADFWRAYGLEPSDVLVFSREPVSIRPQLSLSETYNDNIFYQPDGEEDFLTTISPGVNIRLGAAERNFMQLDYRFAQHFYADQSHLNSGEHSINFRNRFQRQRFSLTGNDQIQFLSSPIGIVEEFKTVTITGPGPGGPAAGGGEGGPVQPIPGDSPTPVRGAEVVILTEADKVDRVAQYHAYNLGYRLSEKTSTYVQGLYTETDYERGVRLYDLNTFRVTGGFGFDALPKTSFFGEVYYGQTATTPNFPIDKNPHSEFVGGFLGTRGEFTPKLAGTVKVGFEHRWFADDSDAPSSPVADVSLGYRFSDKTGVSLAYARVHDASVQFARESYTADIISAGVTQALGTTGKWFASLGGSYGMYDYESLDAAANREYERYSVNFSLAYQIQLWLSANLGYSYESTSSDDGGISEYDVNRVILSLAIGY